MKAKIWLDRLLLWGIWAVSIASGWLLAWGVTVGIVLGSGFWDPDEVAAYLSSSPWERLFSALLHGAILGLVPGIVIALLQWRLLRRSPRDAVLFALAMVVGSALLCSIGDVGPAGKSTIVGLRAGAVGGAIGGWFSGLTQWVILRREVKRANGWILLSTVAWAIGWAVVWAVVIGWPVEWSTNLSFVASIVGGGVVGLGQWVVLRRDVKRAGWWVLATVASWSVVRLPVATFGALIAVSAIIMATTLVLLVSLCAE